jgi:uncharacterized protein YecT (DUF1311 family)
MMRAVLLLLVLSGYAGHARSGPAKKVSKHPIDVAYEKCMSTWQNDPEFMGEPGPWRACNAEALHQWNAELARLVAADKRPTAKAEQAAWVKRRNAAVYEVKQNYAGHLDTMDAKDEISIKQMEFSRLRVLELIKKIQRFSDKNPTKRL